MGGRFGRGGGSHILLLGGLLLRRWGVNVHCGFWHGVWIACCVCEEAMRNRDEERRERVRLDQESRVSSQGMRVEKQDSGSPLYLILEDSRKYLPSAFGVLKSKYPHHVDLRSHSNRGIQHPSLPRPNPRSHRCLPRNMPSR